MRPYLVFIISFLVTFLSIPLLKKLAFKFNILDIPGGRKIHTTVTPLLGGMAIFIGLIAGLLLDLKDIHLFSSLLISATLILIVGLIEDIRGLSVQFRLLCQLVAALIFIAGGERISFLPHGLWGDIGEVIVTLFWIVGVTNTYNYLDGVDGLAAGSAVINLFCFAVILFITGQASLGLFTVTLMFACLGFLPYNIKNSKMFLGDAGSTFLGFTLAGIALLGYWAQENIVKITIPILILGVPIFDIIFTTIMRVKEGKVKTIIEWLRYADKDHFHHYLVDLGLKPLGTVVFIYFITLSLGISAIMLSNDQAIEAFLTLSQALIIFGVIATLIVAGKRHRSVY